MSRIRKIVIPDSKPGSAEPNAVHDRVFRKEVITMVPERIGFELTRLPQWQVLITATRQTLARNCWFATYADAVFFVGAASAACEDLSLFPRLDIEPMGPEGAPTRIKVAMSADALDDQHFQLAHGINATHAALVVDASGTPPVDVAPAHTGSANTANTV